MDGVCASLRAQPKDTLSFVLSASVHRRGRGNKTWKSHICTAFTPTDAVEYVRGSDFEQKVLIYFRTKIQNDGEQHLRMASNRLGYKIPLNQLNLNKIRFQVGTRTPTNRIDDSRRF